MGKLLEFTRERKQAELIDGFVIDSRDETLTIVAVKAVGNAGFVTIDGKRQDQFFLVEQDAVEFVETFYESRIQQLQESLKRFRQQRRDKE